MSDLIANVLNSPVVTALGTALILAVVALWLAAAWWAYQDATRRTESSVLGFAAAGWILLSTPLLLPLALPIYRYVRPATSAAEQREQALVIALASSAEGSRCAACGARTQDEWRRCPACETWLAAACSACGEWAPAGLEICPFCGTEDHAAAIELLDLPVADTAPQDAGWTVPAPAAGANPSTAGTLVAAASRSQA